MLLFALLTLVFTPIHLAVAQSYQLHPVIGSGLLNASSSCQSVFSANVTCVNNIGQLYANPFYDPGDTELTALCTSACASSLDRQRTRVKGACQGAQYYDEYEDTYWLPQYPDEFMVYAYNVACLKRRCVYWRNDKLQLLILFKALESFVYRTCVISRQQQTATNALSRLSSCR